MKTSFKKHWKAVVAFAVGGAMCLGMGVFVLANQSTQTQIADQPQLLLQSADGTHNNGGNAKNGIITVSEWSETGVMALPAVHLQAQVQTFGKASTTKRFMARQTSTQSRCQSQLMMVHTPSPSKLPTAPLAQQVAMSSQSAVSISQRQV